MDRPQVEGCVRDRDGACSRSDLADIHRLVRSEAHLIVKHPWLLFQQAANQPDATAPARLARSRLAGGRERRPWLRWVNKPQRRSSCLLVLGQSKGLATRGFWFESQRHLMGLANVAGALTADGTRMVTALDDSDLLVWELETGRLLARLQGCKGRVTACAASPDGRRIAAVARRDAMMLAAPEGWELKLWDGVNGGLVADLGAGCAPLTALATSPDGLWLAAGTENGEVLLWRATDGAPALRRHPHAARVSTIVFSADRRWMASASVDGTVSLGDVGGLGAAGAVTRSDVTVRARSCAPVNDLALSPDGELLASASRDGVVAVWEARTGREIGALQHDQPVERCLFAPTGGRRVAFAPTNGGVKLWDLDAGTCDCLLPAGSTRSRVLTWSPCGQYLAGAGADHSLWLLHIGNGEVVARLAGHTGTVVYCDFTPHGERIVSAAADLSVRVWDVATALQPDGASPHHRARCRLAPSRPPGVGWRPVASRMPPSTSGTRGRALGSRA